MKIGRTNAITISGGGGGTTKIPYDEWQEGFGYNWDSVIQNAPQTGVQPVLHIYSKVNSIRHISTFPTSVTIVTYNPTTGIYRPVVVNANKNLFFEESDFFINDSDGMSYTCVIYKTATYWGNWNFRTALPMVYSNTKFCTGEQMDNYISLINDDVTLYPFLRGIDCYNPTNLFISAWLEHLTVSVYKPTISISPGYVSDTQIRLLKEFVENAPVNTIFTLSQTLLMFPTISDDKLADWFFNDFFYNNYSGTTYGIGGTIATKNVIKFKINSNILLTGAPQLRHIPNCVYLEGTFTENQLNDTTSAGLHSGFQTPAYNMLQNFPMWKVIGSATTGCLLPMKTQTNVAVYLQGSFDFYSTKLEPNKFCEFDENGIIEDATKYFICNLPFETIAHTNIHVWFRDLTFKNYFTAAQQSAISAYLTNKKWSLQW